MKRTETKLIVAFLMIAAIISSVFYIGKPNKSQVNRYLSIQKDGVEIKRYPYDEIRPDWEEIIRGGEGENTVVMTEEGVRIAHATCPDKICVHMPAISEPGEMIVCLPNKLLLEIVDDSTQGIDVINQ